MSYREIPEDRILRFPSTAGFKGWESFFTEESITHPAKMNLKLLRWILKTYTSEGDVVLDPMAGTGSTIILAALEGRHGIAVEYEEHFCKMIRENIKRTERQSSFKPRGSMFCIQGDARELSKLLEESDAIVTSPPYGNRLSDTAVHDGDPARMGYRQTVDVVLTSPPYSEARTSDQYKVQEGEIADVMTRSYIKSKTESPDNIGNLPHGDIDSIVTSPPFGPSPTGGGIAKEGYKAPGEEEVSDPGLPERHARPLSDDPRNIDNLEYGKMDAVVTSPPYEQGLRHRGQDHEEVKKKLLAEGYSEEYIKASWSQPHQCQRWAEEGYSEDPNNIGNLRSGSYLEAMLQCYREFYKVLKDSGKLILVTKNFIRDKKVVRLDEDTIKLCEASGFTLKDRWYFKLPQISFWRILYRKKFPSVSQINYEDVLIFEKGIKR